MHSMTECAILCLLCIAGSDIALQKVQIAFGELSVRGENIFLFSLSLSLSFPFGQFLIISIQANRNDAE